MNVPDSAMVKSVFFRVGVSRVLQLAAFLLLRAFLLRVVFSTWIASGWQLLSAMLPSLRNHRFAVTKKREYSSLTLELIKA